MIELRHINKRFCSNGHFIAALNDINLTVNKGEILGVIGKSGAGKSTLIRCINLLECPTAGQVYVDGQELTALSLKQLRHVRKHISMIFQQFNLLNALTVLENVALPLRLAKCKTAVINQTILPLLDFVGLGDKKNAFPVQLSGGQKQRVAIARALAMQPKVLLCDEATSSLDPQNTEAILNLLRQIHREFNLTMVVITHEMQVIKQICNRVIVLDDGSIIEQDTLANIFAHPKNSITKNFVASVMQTELPIALSEKLLNQPQKGAVPVWRIYFCGHSAAEPVIAELNKQFGLSLNILQANIECIQHYTIGIMIAAVENDSMNSSAGLHYLLNKGLQVETIGYVARDVV